jgi:glycosyltransferase involved in cell wall biosynthesis
MPTPRPSRTTHGRGTHEVPRATKLHSAIVSAATFRPESGALNVLFVTPYLPSPPQFGGQRRLDGLIREIAHANDVSLLSLVDPVEDSSSRVKATLGYCRQVKLVPHARSVAAGAHKRALQLGSMCAPWSFERVAFGGQALHRALDGLLARDHFDIVQFECVQTASSLPSTAARKNRVPHVLDEHNIEYDILRRSAAAERRLLRKAYHAVNWRKLRTEERRAWARFDGCALTSERDRDLLLEDAPRVRSKVVPNGVDVTAFAPDPRTRVEPDTVLFFGAGNYYPNTEGLLFFLRQVLPLLKLRRPHVRFRIVGQKLPREIVSWRDSAVEVVGYVDDVRAQIASAAVIVVPLRIGGGTRLKVLEAMAMGKATVSTPLGVEGIEVTSGRDVLVGADAESLAAHLARVLENPDLARRLGDAALGLARAKYSWRASAASLSDFHAELIQCKRN